MSRQSLATGYDGKYIVWGCGQRGKYFYRLLHHKIDFAYFIDKNPNQPYFEERNIEVKTPAEHFECGVDCPIIITVHQYSEIINLLKKHDAHNYFLLESIHGLPTYNPNLKTSKHPAQCAVDDAVLDIQIQIIETYYLRFFLTYGGDDLDGMRSPLTNVVNPCTVESNEHITNPYDIVFGHKIPAVYDESLPKSADALIAHGLIMYHSDIVLQTLTNNIPFLLTEDGFIRSIVPVSAVEKYPLKFRQGHSVIFERNGLYINAYSPSRMERLLNSPRKFSEAELRRARKLIDVIIKNRLSKYNHQPSKNIDSVCRPGKNRILVIDQICGDKSIKFGMANEENFADMLRCAIDENPDADIIIKTHPDTHFVGKGYYADTTETDNVHLFTEVINPISLLEQVDKVYVCTSQMGFESLMCGKEVHVFGMPFYAGWGATVDRMNCSRRNKKRTAEEIFHAAYILCTTYVSYETNSVCEIEQAIEEILKLREEFYNAYT